MANKRIETENTERLERLYKNHHKWLLGSANNICKDREAAKEMVSELYLYLAQKINPAIWYDNDQGINSFNLRYCRLYIQTRWLNKVKSDKRLVEFSYKHDDEVLPYDTEFDKRLEDTYNELVKELHELERTRMWASSKLAQLYFFDDEMTLDQLATNIKISKSTAFLNVKKIKVHLKNKLNNPFTKDENTD